jgi:tetratricopeptide (TPR) repeat protein
MSKRLMLIGWEAADWSILHPLIDAGKMPTLQRIVEQGASGSLLCGRPLLPAAQWTSLVTGKRPWQHRVCHQIQLDAGVGRTVPISAAHRKAVALWEMLAREGKKSLIVGWPATQDARSENTTIASNRYAEPTAGPGIKPWPTAAPGTYWPDNLGTSLDDLRVSPEDIQGDLLSQYVPDWKKIDQKKDRRLGHLRVFIAADLSHHAALMHLLRAKEWSLAAIQFPALGAISALFLPYCAPKRDWVSESEFQLYANVLNAACIILDRMLHSLIQAAGKETAVVVASAHGINQNLPPHYLRGGDPESWKTSYGILAACGPGFSRDSLILGATIQDVTPTILTWFGLPIGEDMEGRVLMESFADDPGVKRLASWETGNDLITDQTDPTPVRSPDSAGAIKLGQESEWNLALSYLDGARYDEALLLLEKLFRSFPERADFGLALFQCQLTVKKTAEAAAVLEILLEAIPPGVWSLLPQVELLIAQSNRKEARLLVDKIQKLKPADPEALRRLGFILWRLREWSALAGLAREVLQRYENEPLAWLGLAESALRLRDPAQAVEAATRAIGLNYFLPQAHQVLFQALLMQGKWTEAREAMQTLRRIQPDDRVAAAYSRRTGPGESRTTAE